VCRPCQACQQGDGVHCGVEIGERKLPAMINQSGTGYCGEPRPAIMLRPGATPPRDSEPRTKWRQPLVVIGATSPSVAPE